MRSSSALRLYDNGIIPSNDDGVSPYLGTICSLWIRPETSSKRLVLQHFSTENRRINVRRNPAVTISSTIIWW
jgi:hypothetical protein